MIVDPHPRFCEYREDPPCGPCYSTPTHGAINPLRPDPAWYVCADHALALRGIGWDVWPVALGPFMVSR